MKIIVTIFQCKRIALPYLFINYACPMMQRKSGFDFEIYLIQHMNPRLNFGTATSFNSATVDLVKEFTKQKKFDRAKIIQHSETHEKTPAMPSYKKGVELFLNSDATYHLWLEDDAIVFDENCAEWPKILEQKDCATFYKSPQFIHCAHLVTTKKFDERFYKLTQQLDIWDIENWHWDENHNFIPDFGHVEYFTTMCSTNTGVLNWNTVTRIHMNKPNANFFEVVNKLKAPETMELLSLDFDYFKTADKK
jgi:hypothetical protein